MGLPFTGSPLCFPLPDSPVERVCARPHPCRKGRGGCGGGNPGMFVSEPTSLRRGEGLVAMFLHVAGTELRYRGGGWW